MMMVHVHLPACSRSTTWITPAARLLLPTVHACIAHARARSAAVQFQHQVLALRKPETSEIGKGARVRG